MDDLCRNCQSNRRGKGSLITSRGAVFCNEKCNDEYEAEMTRLRKIRENLSILLNTTPLILEHHRIDDPVFEKQEIARMLGSIASAALGLQYMILKDGDDLITPDHIREAEEKLLAS